jgi:hypothetical protein
MPENELRDFLVDQCERAKRLLNDPSVAPQVEDAQEIDTVHRNARTAPVEQLEVLKHDLDRMMSKWKTFLAGDGEPILDDARHQKYFSREN